MSEQPLAQFTYDNIPPLPEGPSADQLLPSPGPPVSPQQFNTPLAATAPGHGIPLFELVAHRLPDGSFMNVEIVQILTPGDTKAAPVRKVTDELRMKYREYYAIWKQGLRMSPTGTPLEMWPVLTPALVLSLKTANIFTVEQLRDVSDVNLHMVPTGQLLRQQARDWLELKVNADKVTQQSAENMALKDGQRQLTEQIAALNDQIKALTFAANASTGDPQVPLNTALAQPRPVLGKKQ